VRVTTMTPSIKTNREAIEDVLCSKTRWKILKLLLGSQLTPSQIAKAVGVNYQVASRHLEVLETEGILTSVKFGVRIRFYKYNEFSLIATVVQRLIESFKID
jgi:predicted transcriptional regulator